MSIDPTGNNISTVGYDANAAAAQTPADDAFHEIQHGEKIEDIAAQHGVDVQTLLAQNPQITNPDTLYPGDVLVVDPGPAPAAEAKQNGTFTGTEAGKPDQLSGTETNGVAEKTTSGVTLSDGNVKVNGSTTETTTSTTLNGEAVDGEAAKNDAALTTSSSTSRTGGIAYNEDTGTVTGDFGGGVSTSVARGGYGANAGLSNNNVVAAGSITENGVTTYNMSVDTSVKGTLGVTTPVAGVQGSLTAGANSKVEISMPEQIAAQTNVLTIDPMNPESMPTGTKAQYDSATYHGAELKTTFRNVAVSTSTKESEGTSLLVEKVGEDQVRVTAGPTDAITAMNSAGIDIAGKARLMLGRSDSLSSSTLQTAQFNLATTEGRAAFDDYVSTGALPDQNSLGATGAVSAVKTVSTVDYSSQTKIEVGVGPLGASFDGAKNTGNSVWTSYPDGTSEQVATIQYSGNVPMEITRTFDPSGNEIANTRTYEYTISADENIASMLNVATSGDINSADGGAIEAGDTVTLTFNEAQMAQLQEMTEDASGAFDGRAQDLGVLTNTGPTRDGPAPSTQDFAVSLARNLGGSDFGQAQRLFQISGAADGNYSDNNYTAIPATVSAQ